MFSALQEYILAECYARRVRVARRVFEEFYSERSPVKKNLRVKIITCSLERLIDRGLLTGYGLRTPQKWFIEGVKITRAGIRVWQRNLARRQRRLPL